MKWRTLAMIAGGVAALSLASAVVVLRSGWLREQVRRKLTRELAEATGARVEIGRFDYRWQRLEVELSGLVLHGLEAPEQAPLLRVPRVRLSLGLGAWRERRLELRSLTMSEPEAHIYVAADGTTNVPHPARARTRDPLDELLRMKIGEAVVERAKVELAGRAYGFSVRLEGLDSTLRYAARPARYVSEIHIGRLATGVLPELKVDGAFALEATRLDVGSLHIAVADEIRTLPRTWLAMKGVVEDFGHPAAHGAYSGRVDADDLPNAALRAGLIESAGEWSWRSTGGIVPGWQVSALAKARGLEFAIEGQVLRVDTAEGRCGVNLSGIHCAALRGTLFGGSFTGRGQWDHWEQLEIAGAVSDVAVQQLRPLVSVLPPAWVARAAGEASFRARWSGGPLGETTLTARVHAAPEAKAWPLEGDIDLEWRAASDQVEFGPSVLKTGATRVEFNGELDRKLNVKLESTDAGDLERGLRLGLQRDEIRLPFRLERGSVRASGTLEGALMNPAIEGRLEAAGVIYENTRMESLSARARVSQALVELGDVRVRQGDATVTGSMAASLAQWRLRGDSKVSGSLALKQADLATLARLLGTPEAAGRGDIAVSFRGTYDRPEATVRVAAPELTWRGEHIQKVNGEVRFRNAGKEEIDADVSADGARYTAHGVYDHASGEWRNGRLEFQAHVAHLALATLENLAEVRPGLTGSLDGELGGVVRIERGGVKPERLEGQLAATKVKLDGADLGHAEVALHPLNGGAAVELSATLEGARVQGSGKLLFTDELPLEARLAVPRLSLRLLRTLGVTRAAKTPDEPLPVRGFLEGTAEVRVALARPKEFHATAEISHIQMRPRSNEILDTQIDPSDLTLRNAAPIRLEADHTGVRVRQARFIARQTDLTLEGAYVFQARQPWDLHLTGGVDLAIVGTYRPEFQTAGSARIDAAVRGPAEDPQLSGRMTIANASLYLRDVPNGIEQANGTIYFEKNRASIEKISGRTGSGTFELSGFVAFGAENSYRLQAKASSIRVRYPEGVSTLLDADLSLTGTDTRSLLSGSVTIARSGFTSQTDLAGMVAQSGSPVPLVATDSEFLRNVQFDVRIRTTPNATLVSQYTQDIQTEADLRLRGSLIKPVLLGRVQVHQGLVQFFGNRYTISRGQMLFYSTATLAPSIDLDLETRIRGVTVYLNVSGPLNRLKVNYRSDPPLQANEILALLTVGRAPATQSTALPTAAGAGNPAVTEDSTNSLLGGALSGAVSERVERFFGASRIKIDPQVTGVDNMPQSRITVEQSISRDVTLTFVTNLNRAQQQVVRFEWDLSGEWSLVAVRDENGVLGVDFMFKKRFR
jgi:translocation and assembly module TamB